MYTTADIKELLKIFIFSVLHNRCTQHPGYRCQASPLCLHETSYLKNLLTHFCTLTKMLENLNMFSFNY